MWIILVWIISASCYLPLHFERLGYAVPNVLIQAKYLFVIVPIVYSLICVNKKVNIKNWMRGLFVPKVEFEALILCSLIAFFGISCTSILNKEAWSEISLPFNILYLFCMATLEEIAWRGFRLEYILCKKTKGVAIFIVSLEWALWHIPMWVIRNSIGLNEIVFWLMYTVLIGSILGKCMVQYKNIIVPIILHTIFNVCFLMPIKISVIFVLCIWIGVLLFGKAKRKTSNL